MAWRHKIQNNIFDSGYEIFLFKTMPQIFPPYEVAYFLFLVCHVGKYGKVT
jgi:hypothetical protein